MYRQFASKEELYEAVVARLDGIRARLTASSASVDPTERIRMLAVAYAAHFLESPQFFPMWATGKLNRDWGLKSRVSKSLDRRFAEAERQVAGTIEAAVEKGVLRPLGTPLLTTVAIGIFMSVIQHHLLRAKSRDAEACVAEMLELFFRGAGQRA
ncbi:MAG TPA: hypothetical protein VKB92_07280 [Myxococcales bacterium]|nr:hypothetical protein [Myxococcales bacterium]